MRRREPRVGLLPLYLELYDKTSPETRIAFDPLLRTVREGFSRHGVEVVEAPVCRLEHECRDAVERFEQARVDAIVTLHLAYSPSLASAPILAESELPLILLDTTLNADFGPGVDPKRIMFNHGIHGVQDLACMLRRLGKPYEVVAGHVSESDVLDRAAGLARSAYAARSLQGMGILRIGEPFQGMGDFSVSDALLAQRFDVTVTQLTPEALSNEIDGVSEAEVDEEVAADQEAYAVAADGEVHRRSVRAGLGLRRRLAASECGAFTMNFLAFDRPDDTVPFLEASKAMSRGYGYAGEGDTLTAALVGALSSAFERTTFTEIFCPDWRGGLLFLSHMGELNPAVGTGKARLCEKDFPFTAAANPAILTSTLAPGAAVLVNLAPGPDDTFRLILAPVTIPETVPQPQLQDVVHGWVRPRVSLPTFLEQYSIAGGTHHSALVLGVPLEALAAFARFTGLECVTIPEGTP